MQAAPSDTDQQIQWLVDRAAISDLLTRLPRCADTKDWQGLRDSFADDGVIVVPYGTVPASEIPSSTAKILSPFESTHHLIGNIEIDVNGDTATSHHYVLATHLPDKEDLGRHSDIGGWYDNEYRRTDEGWKFTRLDLTFVYADGIPFEPGM